MAKRGVPTTYFMRARFTRLTCLDHQNEHFLFFNGRDNYLFYKGLKCWVTLCIRWEIFKCQVNAISDSIMSEIHLNLIFCFSGLCSSKYGYNRIIGRSVIQTSKQWEETSHNNVVSVTASASFNWCHYYMHHNHKSSEAIPSKIYYEALRSETEKLTDTYHAPCSVPQPKYTRAQSSQCLQYQIDTNSYNLANVKQSAQKRNLWNEQS